MCDVIKIRTSCLVAEGRVENLLLCRLLLALPFGLALPFRASVLSQTRDSH